LGHPGLGPCGWRTPRPDGKSPEWVQPSECIILITISIGNVKFHRSSRKAHKTLVVLG
jgi:hypothetical protein